MTRSNQPLKRRVRLSHWMVAWMDRLAPLFSRKRIASIDTATLTAAMNDQDSRIVLVDVRSDSETDVSIIPGAITRDEFLTQRDAFADKIVVAYCTVGGRSLMFAQQCARWGFDARNYQGGILAWCAAGQPLQERDGTPTSRVHTHNRLFCAPSGYETIR